MALELKEYLMTGQLGPIRCGMTLDEVLASCGPPEARKKLFNPDGSISEREVLGYNALGMSVESGRIALYGLYFEEEGEKIPDFLEPAGYFPFGGRVTPREFGAYLKAEGIPYRRRTFDEAEGYEVFTEGGVAVADYRRIYCLVVPCPGTGWWRRVKGPQHRFNHLLSKGFPVQMGLSYDQIIEIPLLEGRYGNVDGKGVDIWNMLVKRLNEIGATPQSVTVEQIWQVHKATYIDLGHEDWAKELYEKYFMGRGVTY